MRRQAFLLSLIVLVGLGAAFLGRVLLRDSTQAAKAFEPLPAKAFEPLPVQAGSLITYIANEGVLIEAGGKKVVIDGMFRQLAGYARPSDAMRHEMENALGRFADVDLVLATHYHGDHFDARVVRWHLAANPKAHFVAVRQVTGELAKAHGYDQVASRVVEVTPDFGQRKEMRVADINLSVLRLRHGNAMNAAFLFAVPGVPIPKDSGSTISSSTGIKILHVGDADGTIVNFDGFDLQKEGIDYALVPYWYALDAEGIKVIREHIAPKQVIFFHIPEDNPDDVQLKQHMDEMGGRAGLQQRIKAEFPGAQFLLDPLRPPRR